MKTVTQVTVSVGNQPGALVSVCEALAGQNVEAICCTAGSDTAIHLVVSDASAAEAALSSVGSVSSQEILCFSMQNKPGGVAAIATACSDAGVNIERIYATTAGDGEATVYAEVDDVAKAQEACASV